MIADTSLEAYDPQGMAPLREIVYRTIADCNMLSIRDLANILDRDTSTISGRIRELTIEGRIRDWDRKVDPITGKKVKVWEAVA